MANANVFMSMLQPVKSVQDYDDERDVREVNRMALQDKRRASQVADQTFQQQTSDRNALQRAAMESGGDQNKLIQLLRASGSAGLMTQADGLEKSMLERRKTDADVGKTSAETLGKHLDAMKFLSTSVMANPSPQNAALAVDAFERMTGRQMPEERQKLAGLQTPEQVKAWAAGHALQADQLLPKLQSFNAGGAQVNQAVNPLTGVPTETGRTAITQSADNAATQATSRANNAATVGATIRGQNLTDDRARDFNAISQQARATAKPMPGTAVKLQNEDLEAIGTFRGLDSDLAALESQLSDGKLKLGLATNAVGSGLNAVGMSTENSRNLASFKAKLENMRNSVLLLNKGVQTEGDANRAMAEIMANINDGELVKQRLAEIRALNKRAADIRKNNVDLLRSNYGAEPMDFSKYDQQPAALGLPKPGTPAKTKSGATASNW